VLGRIALREGAVEEAERYLCSSFDLGSPMTFALPFALARELVEAGHTRGVLEYLRMCERVWRHPPDLPRWQAQVRDHEVPSEWFNG